MRWVRRHRAFAGWLALFALCLQLTLSFGHVHRGPTAAIDQASNITAPDPGPQDRADDLCAICVLGRLLATALASASPSVTPPVALRAALVPPPPAEVFAPPQCAAFRSRAPPIPLHR